MAWVSPASAENSGLQGCSPGYWKTHTESWEEYTPDVTLDAMITNANNVQAFVGTPAAVQQYATTTMIEALNFGGGNGLDGAARILLRQAVAAYLNAAHEGVGYPLRRNAASDVIAGELSLFNQLNAALDSGSRETMLSLASKLDGYNNLGCTLS